MSVEAVSNTYVMSGDRHLFRYNGRIDRDDVDEFFLRDRATYTTQQAEPKSEGQSLSFFDMLDVVNPLQHIPVVNDLYRDITGDEISPQAQVLGGTLYGGPVGLMASAASMLFEQVTGDSPGGTIMTALGLKDEEASQATQVAMPGPIAPAPSAVQAMTEEVPVQMARKSSRPINAAPVGSPAANSGETVFVTPAGRTSSPQASMAQVAAAQAATAEQQVAAVQAAQITPAAGQSAANEQSGGRTEFMENLLRTRGVRAGAVSLTPDQRAMAADALKATNASPALMHNQARATEPAEGDDIPTLTDGSMNAILQAFGQPQAATPSSQPAEQVVTSAATGQSARIPQPAADPMAMMQQALDRYQKMKAQQAGTMVKETL